MRNRGGEDGHSHARSRQLLECTVALITPKPKLNTTTKAGVGFYASVWPEPG